MPTEVSGFLRRTNAAYEAAHRAFEDQFWGTKMNLAEGTGQYTAEKLAETKTAMEALLEDPATLKLTEEYLAKAEAAGAPEEDRVGPAELRTLKIFQRTFKSYQMTPEAKPLREKVTELESALEMQRNAMASGYVDPEKSGDEAWTKASSVALRQLIRTNANEATRKAAYEGVRQIGSFICDNGWLEIVKLRNQMAKKLGYECFYDYKVTQAEGFNKKTLFAMMDDLESKTQPIMAAAIAALKKEKGEEAFQPWNLSFNIAGDVTKKQDPYFPFEKAVLRYAECYANMRIQYRGATLNLDLLDREKKYSNGFCHWPVCAWECPERGWVPSTANFTSLAIPDAVGSGKTALATLMHEAGHAAHFANVSQPSPLFSQERAPTSVAYAENQSMFLDSLVEDADWLAKYALNRAGEPIPFELIEEQVRSTHPYAVFGLRNMLVVPYFEKALYELPEEQLTKEHVLKLADEVEARICGGLQGRPVLSVPHIMSDEASCYYHGYVLAEMSVHQTRGHFLEKYGYLTDNAHIGPELTEHYWRCGNSECFLDLVRNLTGKPLTSDSWVKELGESVEEKVAGKRKSYDGMRNDKTKLARQESIDDVLGMRLMCSDGDKSLGDSKEEGGSIVRAAEKFEAYVRERYFGAAKM